MRYFWGRTRPARKSMTNPAPFALDSGLGGAATRALGPPELKSSGGSTITVPGASEETSALTG
jgi:hypothetical protein